MSDEPDYGNCSLDELRDAQRHIDAEVYPERAARIEREIGSRGGERAREVVESQRLDRYAQLSKPAVGIFLVASGVISLARTLDGVGPTQSFALVAGVAGPIYGTMILGGICILKRWRVGLPIGLGITLIQVPILEVWRIGYMVAPFPVFELRLWPPIQVAWSMGQRIAFHWFDANRPLYFGVNVTACVVAAALIYHLEQLQAAKKRLQARARAG